MALQKVVVNTSIGWAQDLIEHGKDGFMHHPDDIEAYVDTISKLFDDDVLVNNISQAARKSVENKFDISKLVHKNLDTYKLLCEDEY